MRMTPDGSPRDVIHSFGYGSNLCLDRLEARLGGTGTAVLVAVGYLSGYRFRFRKRSQDKNGDPQASGKGDALRTDNPADRVWGAIFEIDRARLPQLDEAEGLGHGYRRDPLPIQVGDKQHEALVYLATDIDDSLVPYDWYRRLVIDGLRSWPGIPEEYISQIEALSPGRPDPVKKRREEEWAWRCGRQSGCLLAPLRSGRPPRARIR